jgi:N-acetylglucosaminyl-diphospho-decaprenol L-rhamnosyltransferase
VADVTVSIVNTNGRELLLGCLESLADVAADIVVLDNASEDGSAVAVRERFPHVQVIAQEVRAGFGANHNRVIRATSGRYVFVLNEDTIVPADTIDGLVAYLDAHPEVAVAGPLIRGFDGRQQGSAWRLMTIPVQLLWALTLGQRAAVQSRGSRPKRVGAVAAGAALYRRAALEQVGLFDEGYFMFGEEGDLARRWDEVGLERHYVPTVELLHAGQHSTEAVPERQINEVWRSMDRYLGRWHSPLDRRVLTWLTGTGYALALVAAEVGRRLPTRVRPAAAATWNPGIYRLHVRNAFRGVRDPGMRELAEEWNQSSSNRAVGDVSSASVSGA